MSLRKFPSGPTLRIPLEAARNVLVSEMKGDDQFPGTIASGINVWTGVVQFLMWCAAAWVKESLNTREWSVAAATVHEWEAAREIGGKRLEIPSINEAISKYLEDSEARHH